MIPFNHVTPRSRWPLNPVPRIEWADTQMGFAAAMTNIMGGCKELNDLAALAFRHRIRAQDELALMEVEDEAE